MGRIRAIPLLLCAAAGGLLVSGASGADPSTPAALPGRPAPFLGTAVVGSGGLLAAVDAYGDVVDLRVPGPAGEAEIVNRFARQAAGSVPSDTGVVPSVGAGSRPPLQLWHASRLRQRYLPATNVLRTGARVAGAGVSIEDAAAGAQLTRRIVVRGRPGKRLVLRLDVNLDLGGEAGGDAISHSGGGFVQHDGSAAYCLAMPTPTFRASPGDDVSAKLTWHGWEELRAELSCRFAGGPQPAARLTRQAISADRRWLARRRPLRSRTPGWAQQMYTRSLLVLRALTDRGSGASVAGARDRWAYIWPRDAGAAALALAASGYRSEARRIASFLTGLDLEAGARFRGDSSPVTDGRALPGDAAGWVRAAALSAGGPAPRPEPGAWRGRGDYGERDGDRGDYLANAIAGGASAAEIKRLFAARSGLHRRAGDAFSGLDSAAAWAVQPFARPQLFTLARRSLLSLEAQAGGYGISPSQDWPDREAWTAPAAWSAWSLATLGNRTEALRLFATLRRASTPVGTIPERVKLADGLPRSTTPLGWSHAFAVLALHRLYPRR
jgi:glucoamylase